MIIWRKSKMVKSEKTELIEIIHIFVAWMRSRRYGFMRRMCRRWGHLGDNGELWDEWEVFLTRRGTEGVHGVSRSLGGFFV